MVFVARTCSEMSRINSYKCACACQADKQKCDNLQTDEEQRERQACEAGMQHLPSGIQPQTAQQPAGVCHVCYVEDYSDDNLLLEVSLTNSACNGKVIWAVPRTTGKASTQLVTKQQSHVFHMLVLVWTTRSQPCCQNQLSSAAAHHKVHALLLVCQSVQQSSHGLLGNGYCLADVQNSLLRQQIMLPGWSQTASDQAVWFAPWSP